MSQESSLKPELSSETAELLRQHLGYDPTVCNERLFVEESSSDEETEEGNKSFDYAAYYKSLYPERYKNEDEKKQKKKIENPVALITYEDEYVRDLLIQAFEGRKKDGWEVYSSKEDLEMKGIKDYHYHFGDYEHIDFFSEEFEHEKVYSSCYFNRKGLIRKANVARTLKMWETKRNKVISPQSWPISFSSNESNDLSDEVIISSLASVGLDSSIKEKRFIIKPSMTNQAEGILLAADFAEVVSKIKSLDELSLVGALVVQDYISPWLLKGRKFHLRVFVVLIGSLKAYVCQDMLSIFSLLQYKDHEDSFSESRAHLTNISHQNIDSLDAQHDCMRLFDETVEDIIESGHAKDEITAKEIISSIKDEVNEVTSNVVEAVSTEAGMTFRDNCFEIFGFDFLVDNNRKVLFLEANAEPDLAKAGDRLQPCIDQLLRDVVIMTTDDTPVFPSNGAETALEKENRMRRMKLVFEKSKK